MNYAFLYSGIFILVLAISVCPVQAFTAKTLDIAIQDNGDALITFDYDLNWYENAAVFTRIMNPGIELKKALEANFGKQVDVITVTGNQVQVLVQGFATRKVQDNLVIMGTPALSFNNAEKVLNQYWFAPLINVDLSPAVTHVIFPDGYVEMFSDQIAIPKLNHILGNSVV
jgi:hypothetical protein